MAKANSIFRVERNIFRFVLITKYIAVIEICQGSWRSRPSHVFLAIAVAIDLFHGKPNFRGLSQVEGLLSSASRSLITATKAGGLSVSVVMSSIGGTPTSRTRAL
jgi:hypothetical protein